MSGGQQRFDVRASKVTPSTRHSASVPRTQLLDLLDRSTASITSVVAPPGYGKTTLLTQWAEFGATTFAWLSLDDADNDPAVLFTDLAASLDRITPGPSGLLTDAQSVGSPVEYVPPLLAALDGLHPRSTLIIDNLECLTKPESADIIAELALGCPHHVRLVVSSRVHPRLPLARLRVEGRLLELGADHLELALDEARHMLDLAEVDADDDDVRRLVDDTEGWPAGLYLATLAAHVGGGATKAAAPAGDSRFVGDYLRSEILDHLSVEDVSFLVRTSVLDTLSGPLCDATLDTSGSAVRLDEIGRRNLMVGSLDDRREWYRCHRMFRDLLRGELQRRQPELVPQLHARAAQWYEADQRLEEALGHAQAAHDADRVASLLSQLIQPAWAKGRSETVHEWLHWLAAAGPVGRYPELAVHGALMHALAGHASEAESWADAAASADPTAVLPDGNTTGSLLAYLRAFLCRDGIRAMERDSTLAYTGLASTSPYRPSMLFTEGLAHLLDDDSATAHTVLVRALDAAEAIGATPVAALVGAVLSQIEADRGDWAEASALSERALHPLVDGTFDSYWSSALVWAWGARIAAHAGRIDEARQLLARATRLRPLLTYALPVVSTMALLEMAHVSLALSDADGATTVLRQAAGILEQRPDLGSLGRQVEDLDARLAALPPARQGGSSLTNAELRLAPLLATHLSLNEIGERLFISRSTAKTHTLAIYRKIGATTRSEAVDTLRELGLIG